MNGLKLNDKAKARPTKLVRIIVLVPIIMLGNQLCRYVHSIWADYWLNKDGKSISVLVTATHPKRIIDYRYTVDGKEYNGSGLREWEDEKVHSLQIGEPTSAIISVSHPWLSSLQTSRRSWLAALPVMVVMLLFVFLFLGILVGPNGRWSVSRWLWKLHDEGKL